MAFQLQQIVVPVAILGAQEDKADPAAWQAYFEGLLATMRTSLPCKGNVYLSEDLGHVVFGESYIEPDPSDTMPLITQSSTMRVYVDRSLAEATVRLE